MLEVEGHRVLIEPEHFAEEIGDGALEGVQLNIGEDWKRDRAATVIGVIKGVGPNAWLGFDNGDLWSKVGDKVYYAKYSGKVVIDGEKSYLVINDEDCICIVHDEESK